MKVRITKAKDCNWYKNFIGSVFDVEPSAVGNYYVINEPDYLRNRRPNSKGSFCILGEHCEVVHLLPPDVFDPIYEECKRSGRYRGELFPNIVRDASRDADLIAIERHVTDEYGLGKKEWVRAYMDAYALGEIREGGVYIGGYGYPFNKQIEDWYKLDPKEFDKLVDDPDAFANKACRTNEKLYMTIADANGRETDGGATTPDQDANIIVSLYRGGILRKGGAMPDVCPKCGKAL